MRVRGDFMAALAICTTRRLLWIQRQAYSYHIKNALSHYLAAQSPILCIIAPAPQLSHHIPYINPVRHPDFPCHFLVRSTRPIHPVHHTHNPHLHTPQAVLDAIHLLRIFIISPRTK